MYVTGPPPPPMMTARVITTIYGCLGLRSRSRVVMTLAVIMEGGGVLIKPHHPSQHVYVIMRKRNEKYQAAYLPRRTFTMSKKLTSTLLLFAVFVGFLWWGLSMLFSPGDIETKIYALLLLVCSGYAGVSLLLLPRKKQP